MKTILVVDDEEHIRLLFQEEFQEAGYRVVFAETGEQALQKNDELHPDLVTLDIKMEGMSGIEVARQLKEKRRDLPILFWTAYEDFKQNFGTWSAEGYFIKSGNLRELKNKIHELLPP